MFTVYVYSYNEAVPGVSIITVGSFNMISYYGLLYCDQFNSFNSVTILSQFIEWHFRRLVSDYLCSLLSDNFGNLVSEYLVSLLSDYFGSLVSAYLGSLGR